MLDVIKDVLFIEDILHNLYNEEYKCCEESHPGHQVKVKVIKLRL